MDSAAAVRSHAVGRRLALCFRDGLLVDDARESQTGWHAADGFPRIGRARVLRFLTDHIRRTVTHYHVCTVTSVSWAVVGCTQGCTTLPSS